MKNWFLALCLLMAIPVARAGIQVEPYLGYAFGGSEATVLNTAYEYSYSTPMAGARFGLGRLGFSLGADYSMSLGTYELEQDKPASAGPYAEMKNTNFGIYLGYKFPILVRVWGTYFLSNTMEADTSRGSTDKGDKYTGTGYALGAGFTGLPFVALNLEYRMITFDEYTDGVTGVKTKLPVAGALSEIEHKEIILSVSLPLDFF